MKSLIARIKGRWTIMTIVKCWMHQIKSTIRLFSPWIKNNGKFADEIRCCGSTTSSDCFRTLAQVSRAGNFATVASVPGLERAAHTQRFSIYDLVSSGRNGWPTLGQTSLNGSSSMPSTKPNFSSTIVSHKRWWDFSLMRALLVLVNVNTRRGNWRGRNRMLFETFF